MLSSFLEALPFAHPWMCRAWVAKCCWPHNHTSLPALQRQTTWLGKAFEWPPAVCPQKWPHPFKRKSSFYTSSSEPIFGKGMTLQWKKGFSVKRGEAIQWMRGLVRISTGKAIQWRGPGHSVNRRTLKTEKLLSSSPSRKSALSSLSPTSSRPWSRL